MNTNSVIITGNLVRDPELRETNAGPVCSFAVAVNGYKDDDVSYVDVTAWNKTAELVTQYCSKGKKVAVTGRLKQDRWQDNDGNNRSKLAVVASQVEFLSSVESDAKPEGKTPRKSRRPDTEPDYGRVVTADEIPF